MHDGKTLAFGAVNKTRKAKKLFKSWKHDKDVLAVDSMQQNI